MDDDQFDALVARLVKAQSDTLQRVDRGVCAPLGMMAVSSHDVMRDESLRLFCPEVDPRFVRLGPEPFGGDI